MANVNIFYLETLNHVLKQRVQKNRSYSLRQLAKDLNVSPATLSLILNQKKGLSEKMAEAMSERLKLDSHSQNLFVLSATALFSRNKNRRKESSVQLAELAKRHKLQSGEKKRGKNLILYQEDSFLRPSQEVQEMMERLEVFKTYRYASLTDGFHVRILKILKDKETGKVVQDFIQIVLNEKNSNASIVYFIKKKNGKFKSYFNQIMNGQHQVTGLIKENQNTQVKFDKNHLPRIPHIHFIQLASNRYSVGSMIYTENQFIVEGSLIDHDDDFANPRSNFKFQMRRIKI